MVDPFHVQDVERGLDVGRRPLLARVRHQVQAQGAAALEHAREFFRRVAALGGIEPHANDLVQVRQGLVQRDDRLVFGQMAQEAHDQAGADGALLASAPDAVDHCLNGNAARGMGLRVEKDFRVQDVVGMGARQIGRGHVVEVLFGEQHACTGVIDIEKRLQIGEGVRGAQLFHRAVGQRDAISLSQLKDQFRLE